MEKVEEHLRNNHMRRDLDEEARGLLRQMEGEQQQETEFSAWGSKALGNISMKLETFIQPKKKT